MWNGVFIYKYGYLRPPDELLPELLPLLLPELLELLELPEDELEELGAGLLTEELRLGCDIEPELLLLLLGCETLSELLRTGCELGLTVPVERLGCDCG